MSKRSHQKSGSRAARSKKYVPRVCSSKPPRSRVITRYEPPPRTDGYLDDGPERDEDMLPLFGDGAWFVGYTATPDGRVPFDGEFGHDELQEDEWNVAFEAWCESARVECRDAHERCEPRAALNELFQGVIDGIDAGPVRDVAPQIFDALVRYVDSILRPTAHVIFGWIHPDRFAEALPRFLALDPRERAPAFSALAALFRARAIDGSLNEDRAGRLAADFDRLADAAPADVEPTRAIEA